MVPVLDEIKRPLMPCSEKRARKLLETGRAKPYWCKGIFCVILQESPKTDYKQEICVGIDPGSKFNGYSVKSAAHTLTNIQANAITTVKAKMEERAALRRGRRGRKTPYRKCRSNRAVKERLPASTKARWQQHLNVVRWMSKLYPVTHVALEDVAAKTMKGARKWNVQFSPLEVGKHWFAKQVESMGLPLYKFKGYDTYEMRKGYGFKKNSNKDKKDFYTHAVDAWCLANEVVGGHTEVDNERTLYLKPLMFHRRKLHEILPKKNGRRRPYGGTMSAGIKRGTLVKHPKWGLTYVGGTDGNRVSLHHINTGKRLCQNARVEDLKLYTTIKYLQEPAKAGAFLPELKIQGFPARIIMKKGRTLVVDIHNQ